MTYAVNHTPLVCNTGQSILIPPTAAVIGSGLGTWSQPRPIIIFVRDNKGKALPTQWLLQPSSLPWSNSSGKNDVRLTKGDTRNTKTERESQQHIWTTFTLGLPTYTNLYVSFWPVLFGLLSLTTVTVFSDYSSCSSNTHCVCVCACVHTCVCVKQIWDRVTHTSGDKAHLSKYQNQ